MRTRGTRQTRLGASAADYPWLDSEWEVVSIERVDRDLTIQHIGGGVACALVGEGFTPRPPDTRESVCAHGANLIVPPGGYEIAVQHPPSGLTDVIYSLADPDTADPVPLVMVWRGQDPDILAPLIVRAVLFGPNYDVHWGTVPRSQLPIAPAPACAAGEVWSPSEHACVPPPPGPLRKQQNVAAWIALAVGAVAVVGGTIYAARRASKA